jgi:hypothetical protein
MPSRASGRHRARHRHHAAFGRGVGVEAGLADQRVHRCRQHDRAAPVRTHRYACVLGAEERTRQRQTLHLVPHGLRQVDDAAVLTVDERDVDRVVVEHVELAPAVDGCSHHRLHALRVAHVARHVQRLAPRVADAGGDRLAACLIELGDHHARALAREELRAGAADPRTGAGDDRYLVLEASHCCVSFLRSPYLPRFPMSPGWYGRNCPCAR